MKTAIWMLLTAIILSNCSVMKRRYQKGFYFSRHGQKTIGPATRGHYVAKASSPAPDAEGAERSQHAEASADNATFLPLEIRRNNFRLDVRCDTLFMRNGETRVVKVTEITPDLVSYSRCDNIEGPKYSVRKQEVARIVFSNGVSEIIAAPPAEPPMVREPAPARRKYHPAVLVGLGAAVLSLFVPIPDFTGFFALLLIVAAALSIKSLNDMLVHPRTYRGKAWAIITLVYCFLFGLFLVAFLTI